MKTKMKSRMLAILTSLAMIFTMMPVMGTVAYADDPALTAPDISLGPDVLSVGSNTSDAATVHMAGTKWRVIGYGAGTEENRQVASSEGTMTLFAADNLKSDVQFRLVSLPDGNQYSQSILKKEIDALTDDENGIFSAGEKAGIARRNLEPGEYTDSYPYANGIAGDEVQRARLWPLSTQEAYFMKIELRDASGAWWLRSPGSDNRSVAFANGANGNIYLGGSNVANKWDVRPAFNFNLESVIFTSAAGGGKPSEVGAGSLKKIAENSGTEWKLTLKDDYHKDFKVESVGKNGDKKLTIRCSDAVSGNNEYISAIVKTKSDNGKQYLSRYGKLALLAPDAVNVSKGSKVSATVNIPEDLEAGDEIYVFNEQCNADANDESDPKTPAETDYVSDQVKVYTAPNAEITKQPSDLTLNYGDTTGNVLSVEAAAAEGNSLSYQWYSKTGQSGESGTKIDDATDAAYTVPTNQNVGKTLYYYCVVTEKDQYGVEISSTSDPAAVTVNKAKLTITAEDKSSRAGDALKALTYRVSGAYVKGDDLGVAVSTDAKKDRAGTYAIRVSWKGNKNYRATLVDGKYTVTAAPEPAPDPAPARVSGTPTAKMTAKGKTGLVLRWNKIEGADGYDIFFAKCNHHGRNIACKRVKSIKGNKTFKWTKKGLKKKTAYKAYVKAYVMKDGKKSYVRTSAMLHAYTGKGTKNYTNARSVTIKNVRKGKVSLKKGGTFKIKAKVKKVRKNRKLMPKSHAAKLRYMTSDSRVATVSAGGRITAKGKGTCTIVAFAHNGVSKSIEVVVK